MAGASYPVPLPCHVYNLSYMYTRRADMRTNIVIDDELMREALQVTGLKTKREAVEEGLRTLVRLKRQERLKQYRGQLAWEGDLDALRRD